MEFFNYLKCSKFFHCFNSSAISNISEGDLLIFYGLGVALLVFSIQIKITSISEGGKVIDYKIARHAGVYRFIKTVFNWGVIYFICGIFALISSVFPKENTMYRPIFYNISFITALVFTIFLTIAYSYLVLWELFLDWRIARKYGLE